MKRGGRERRARRSLARLLLWALLGLFGITLGGGAAGLVVLNHFAEGLPDVSRLRQYEPAETTRVYAADGSLIATLFKENRTWTPLSRISPHLVGAILATEDSRFHEHRGVDPIGILRAALDLARSRGRIHQGASTITMQLARNLFLSPDQSYKRKVREILLAFQIEKTFTKDEILELYLNQIYFGAGAYGVQSAADTYFGTTAEKLTLVQAAVIAGLPAKPSEYSPLVDERKARIRAIEVLGRLEATGRVTQEEYRKALETLRTGLKVANKNREEFQLLKYPYFTTYVLKQLYTRYDEDLLYRGGLRIYTTLDPKLQERAEAVVRKQVESYKAPYNAHDAALVTIENRNGFIRAMVGGTGWSKESQFNRAWQARRQPGSTFKVFVYTTAIEAGYSPDTVVPDTPVSYQDGDKRSWSPKNSDGRFLGSINLRAALQHSRNVVAVKLLTMVGPERVIEYAYRMGIKERLEPHLSLALGSAVVTPLEMASAFSVFPNAGLRVHPTPIKIIYDSEGNVVEDHTFPRQEEVLSESTAFTMTEMLRYAVEAGTGGGAAIPGRPVAGKTGTTDDFRDAWFCGFTSQFTTAVWVGNDDFARMWRAYGGETAAPIFRQVMEAAHKGLPVIGFGQLKGDRVSVLMCSETRQRAAAKCPNAYKEYVRQGEVPQSFCRVHGRGVQGEERSTPARKKSSGEEEAGEPDPGAPQAEGETPESVPTAVPIDPSLPPLPSGAVEPEAVTPPVDPPSGATPPAEPPPEPSLQIDPSVQAPPVATPEPLPTSEPLQGP